jgi:pyruvate carboxylase subunit B
MFDGAEVRRGRGFEARLAGVGHAGANATVGDGVHRIVVRPAPRVAATLWVDGFRHEVEALDERMRAIRARRCDGRSGGPCAASRPDARDGRSCTGQVGDVVQPGQGLVVMEAMKMENELRAAAATVKAVIAEPGTAVEKGALLIELGSYRVLGFRPGAIASRRARTASTARESSRSRESRAGRPTSRVARAAGRSVKSTAPLRAARRHAPARRSFANS